MSRGMKIILRELNKNLKMKKQFFKQKVTNNYNSYNKCNLMYKTYKKNNSSYNNNMRDIK